MGSGTQRIKGKHPGSYTVLLATPSRLDHCGGSVTHSLNFVHEWVRADEQRKMMDNEIVQPVNNDKLEEQLSKVSHVKVIHKDGQKQVKQS
ncbi:hypothetical protein AVEN_32603-1 [Araneus ventricosus]|uniref:Uncharacterized protein n=1 Tax=Araneus ventricosus TaxID=182803 RepID=A0A4Y2C7C2_ARAVE|nr:hypothetical protein AVEN_32603-1 [Araneus ventricosus]